MCEEKLMERSDRMLNQIMRAIEGGPTGCYYCGVTFEGQPGDVYCEHCFAEFYENLERG